VTAPLSRYAIVLLASLLACAVTASGIFLISRADLWARRNSAYLTSFAAGLLTSVAVLHLIPESLRMHARAPILILVGLLVLALSSRLLHAHLESWNERDPGVDYASGLVPMIGLGLHSFIDGVIFSITFEISLFTGVLAGIGMVLHELPEGVVTYALLKRAGFSRRRSMLYSFFSVALTTPVGAAASFPLIRRVEEPGRGLFLAFAAGALLYVGAVHLLPEVIREKRRFTMAALAAGILVAAAAMFVE
jgi:zinc transporter ZupT